MPHFAPIKKERAGRTTARQTGGLQSPCNRRARRVIAIFEAPGESAGGRGSTCVGKKAQEVKIVQLSPARSAAELAPRVGLGRC